MCFAACGGNAQDDHWFYAAYENDAHYLQQNRKRRIATRDLRFAQPNVYPGFTAFLYAVYYNNLDAMAVVLPEELTLPSLEPVVFEEDRRAPEPAKRTADEGVDASAKEPKRRVFYRKPEDPGPEYNHREFPGNSTSLDLAVHCGNWDAFNLMIESISFYPDEFRALLYYKNEHRECLLHFFVRNGSDRALSELINTGRYFIVYNLDCESDMGVNPVVLSIRMGRINFLEYFLSLGYDDECFQKLIFCLRKQKNKPPVEDLCTPSQMFNTTYEEAYYASFLLAAFRRRSLPPPPGWLVEEMEEKIKQIYYEELNKFYESKEQGPIPPWLKRYREAGILHVSASGDVAEVPYTVVALEKLPFASEAQDMKDGLLHVYDQLYAPYEAKVEVYYGENGQTDVLYGNAAATNNDLEPAYQSQYLEADNAVDAMGTEKAVSALAFARDL